MQSATGHQFIYLLPVAVLLIFWIMSRFEKKEPQAAGRKSFFTRNGTPVAIYLIVAVAFWAIFMIILPQLFMVEMSFRPKLPPMEMFGEKDVYTLQNYHYFLYGSTTSSESINWVHIKAFFLTIFASVLVALYNFVLCYPLAFYMAQVAPAARVRFVLLLLIAPYWVNEILRAFAFRIIFSSSGLINSMLMSLGLLDEPYDFIGNDIALYAGLGYAYMLMMIFSLYNAIDTMDHAQIEAARDLGAPWWHIHSFIVIPFAKPGIASGCTLVFMLSAGSLAAPLVLGGPRSLWFTPILYDRFFQAFNWPQGAAYAFLLLLTCVTFVLLVLRLGRLNLGEIAK
jgi:spermidine/putrescine transport system permease protein